MKASPVLVSFQRLYSKQTFNVILDYFTFHLFYNFQLMHSPCCEMESCSPIEGKSGHPLITVELSRHRGNGALNSLAKQKNINMNVNLPCPWIFKQRLCLLSSTDKRFFICHQHWPGTGSRNNNCL